MADLDRRSFLLLGSASALISAAPAARARTPSASLIALPDAWMHADVLRLWPGSAPGDARFVPQPVPADWPPVYVRNVASPELRVFRPSEFQRRRDARDSRRQLSIRVGGQ